MTFIEFLAANRFPSLSLTKAQVHMGKVLGCANRLET